VARIGLIEIRAMNHELSGLCKISRSPGNEVTVFTTRRLFPHVRDEFWGNTEGYEWVLDSESESTRAYLGRIERVCNQQVDLVIVNSLRDWEFMLFRPRCKVLAFVDDLNWWFRDTRSFRTYVRKLASLRNVTDNRVIVNAVTGPLVRRAILSHLDGVIVEYPPFRQHLLESLGYRGRVYSIPNRSFEGVLPADDDANDGKVRFVAPGRIQEVRRDYMALMRVFERLFPRHKDRIALDLVGEPIGDYGQAIISQCEEFVRKGYDVYFPRGYVPHSVLDAKLRRADAIVSPLQINYRSATVEEVYTVTKPSGIFSDTIRYAKPCVVPDTYRVADEMTSSYLTYKGEAELETLLESLIEDRGRYQTEAVRNSEKFSLARLRDAFDQMVDEVLTD